MKKILFVFLVLGIALWFFGINDPYVGGYAAANTLLSLAAKNYLRFGYLKLHFLPTYFVGAELPLNPIYYLHHPILEYLLLSIAFKIFGFANWVGYLVPLLFSLGSLIFIYLIGKTLWSKRVGLTSIVLASMFPMMTIFGVKQAGFEQGTLFMLLGILYFFIKYILNHKRNNLIFISLFSLGAILIDWGALYLLPIFLILYRYFPDKKQAKNAIFIYSLIITLGTLSFLGIIFLTLGNFNDFLGIIKTRTIDQELFGLSYPLLRLSLITLIRIVIYFTPLVVIAGLVNIWQIIRKLFNKTIQFKETILLFFFLLGLVNPLLVPANSWQHIYFLFYFLPFFALSSGLFLSKLLTKKAIFLISILVFTYSFGLLVSYSKWIQLHKQVWRYEVSRQAIRQLPSYSQIGVYGFPGDVLAYYFNHPSEPLKNYPEINKYLASGGNYVIFSCWGDCLSEDKLYLETISQEKRVEEYGNIEGKVWLILNKEPANRLKFNTTAEKSAVTGKNNLIQDYYRKIRNFLQVGQL